MLLHVIALKFLLVNLYDNLEEDGYSEKLYAVRVSAFLFLL